MNAAIQPRKSLRFRGRSFMALLFSPEPPLEEWFAELDEWSKKSPGYFVGRPVILDVAALALDKEGLTKLIADLAERDIRIMGIEGTKASLVGLGMPPLVSGSRAAGLSDLADLTATPPAGDIGTETVKAATAPEPAPALPAPLRPASMVHDRPVRSGQSVLFPEGDLTVLGSVASGSEVVAGGSIHIYGTLRGRAIAGISGNPTARIFCNKMEAELIAIDGLYCTADEMDPQYRSRPAQAWLEGETMSLAALS